MTQDYYQQGLAKAKAGDYRGAIADFNLAEIATPEWAEVYYRRGLAYFDLGDILTAVGDYTKALSLDREHRDCHYARALARLNLKNFPGALEDIDRAIIYGRDYAPAYQLKGLVCKKLARYQQAIAAYKMAANLYLTKQDLENSRQCLELAQSLQPDRSTAAPAPTPPSLPPQTTPAQFYTQLIEQGERGDLQGAIDNANWAVKTSPNDAQVYSCRGLLYLKQGNLEGSLTDFSKAIELDPNSGVAYRHRGKLRERMGDYRGAIADFDRALTFDDRDPLIYLARANVRAGVSDYSGAISDCDRAIEIEPQEPTAYVTRGQIYAKLEELTQAISDYQTAANTYLDRRDLTKYRETLDRLQQLQRFAPKSAPPPAANPASSSPQHAALRQRLYILVSGQWAIAQRLIDRVKEEEPGYPDDWYLERVIDNLERGL